jgi:cell division protein FtsB
MSQPALQLRSRLPRIADAAIARARLTVVPRARSTTARVPFVVLVSMLLLSGVVGLLLFNTSMQQASFAATALDDQATTLSAREQTLKMELDKLRDPQRVAQEAVKLGMVPPASPAFLELPSGKVLGDALPATRLNAVRLYAQPPAKPRLINPPPIVHTVPADSGPADTGAGAGREGRRGGRNGHHDQQTTHTPKHR